MKKAIFLANTDNFHKNFHLPYLYRLIEKGYEVHIVSSGDVTFDYRIKKHSIVFGRTPLKKENVEAFRELRELFSDYYDLIYFSTPIVGAIGRLALIGKKHGRVVYSAHGYSFFEGNSKLSNLKYIFIEKLLSRLTDCSFTMNAEDYNAYFKYKFKSKEIYNVDGVGVDTSVFKCVSKEDKAALRNEYGYDKEEFILIFPAELTERKNQIELFYIIRELKNRGIFVRLLLAGNGIKREEYIQTIRDMDICDYIELLGYRKDVKNLLALSDCLVASSLNEGLPINVIEGLSSGLPVIASKVRGHVDLIEDGYNGFVFELGDHKTAADKIEQLIKDKELRSSMSRNAKLSSERYDINNVIEQYDKIWGI